MSTLLAFCLLWRSAFRMISLMHVIACGLLSRFGHDGQMTKTTSQLDITHAGMERQRKREYVIRAHHYSANKS